MNEFINNMSVILPSYKPDEKLLAVLEGLSGKGFHDVIVVNDGSGSEFDVLFEKAGAFPNVTVLTHPENRGKGCALKTAFSYCMENRPSCTGVITVDGDNQHHPDDIYACCLKLSEIPDQIVLGARNFSADEVPFRSRFGNVMTRSVFRFACGIRITDTQTGLRAIPAQYLPLMLETAGERYEYETNMLLEMKTHDIPFTEVTIRTIYLDDNDSSHFNPLKDSIKIYRTIFAFLASSLMSALLDIALFFLLISILTYFMPDGAWNVVIATAAARVCSSLFNYLLNSKKVFRSKNKSSLARYYLLCILQFAASAGLVSLASNLCGAGNVGKTLIKAIVDTVLFLISYQIQKEWVFKK
ncbi:MAG: bifunctional glycosyltransferase family 2/GtrA family protein [Lachnospiraceae bacterium]|nr:bifunctional glycosyltransferase family 2/GtrA family protein [Lachnospiraceae bacterium]